MMNSNRSEDAANQRHLEGFPAMEDGRLDRELDIALAKYATVDPRAGLEIRILANVRAERARIAERAWWRWSLAAVLATVFVVAVVLAWRAARPAKLVIKHPPSNTKQGVQKSGSQVGINGQADGTRPLQALAPPRKLTAYFSHPARVREAAPKLEQFPSPQPLNEQEQILGRYVRDDPDHAALIAQARTEELERDRAEEMAEAFPGSGDSGQRNK